jgi:hypothetical protein
MSFWSSYDFTKIPLDKIARVGQRSLLYRDLFSVSWLLGRFCNYKCSYCWPYARSDQKDHRPTELLISTLNEIKRQARERGFNSFHFSFSGGEPTLHPGYLKILEHYSQDSGNTNYQSCHMTSNMSPGIGWLKKYVEATKSLHRVSVTASYHREFAVKEQFAERLIFLQENDVHVTINSVMVPDRFEKTWEDMLYFHELGINVTLKPQSNASATKVVDGYTDDMLKKLRIGMPQRNYTLSRMQEKKVTSQRPKGHQLPIPEVTLENEKIPSHLQVELNEDSGRDWFMDQAERFNAFNFNQFKGWECSSGYRSIIIREPDGFIKRSYSCNDNPLGHIDTGFKLFDGPELCITESCVSSADSKIPKRKKDCKLPLWPQQIERNV